MIVETSPCRLFDPRPCRPLHLSLWLWLLVACCAPAQHLAVGRAAQAAAEPGLTADMIEARRKQAEAAAELDEPTRKRIAELYVQAAESLNRAAESAARAEAFRAQADSVPQRLQQLQQRLEELRGGAAAEGGNLSRSERTTVGERAAVAAEGGTLADVEAELARAEQQLAELKQTQTRVESESAARAARRREVRNLLFTAPQRLQDLERQLEAPSPRDEPALLTLARRTELQARQLAAQQELPALHNELARYDAEDAVDLLRYQRDLSIQEVALAEQTVRGLDAEAKRLRAAAAQAAVQQADDEAFRTLPLLKTLAERNQQLALRTQNLIRLNAEADSELQQAQSQLEEVQRRFNQAKDRVDSIGLTRSVGAQLRKQKASLPSVRHYASSLRQRQQAIEEAHFSLFELDDERTALARPEVIVADILSSAPEGPSEDESQRLRAAAERMLDRQREYLDTLIRTQNIYFDTLSTLDATQRQLIQLTEAYVDYINERVLWIRSGKPLSADLALSPSDLWIVSPAQWWAAVGCLVADARQNPNLTAVALAVLAGFVLGRPRLARRIGEVGELAARRNCTQSRYTFQATAYTLLIASSGPAISGYLSWRLLGAAEASDFAQAVATSLAMTACAIAPIELLRQICRPRGLAEAHFGWPESAVHSLRTNLLLLLLIGAPLVFVAGVLQTSDAEHGHHVLERVFFALACLVTSLCLGRLLSPSSGVLQPYLALQGDGWLDRLKYVWYWLGVAAPLVLAAVAFLGYSYTAQQLTVRLYVTAALLVLLIAARAVLLRLLLVHRRHLSIRQARQRRAAAMAALAAEGPAVSHSRTMIPVEEVADLAQLSTQTQRIMTTLVVVAAAAGIWCVWDDVVPALKILDNWSLWTTVVHVSETSVGPAGQPLTTTRELIQSVTLADLLLALLVAVITVIAFRNIPGLMEIFVLQRLPLEPSVRYAITTLASYTIIMLGVVFACSTLGLRWSQIQWLATALTFGLAFGLQEMFANFVAGLIILFERPIRVGDVVTVADVTGVVSRVRIRATTITNWDRKEFVVPNKEFITGRLLNWTLSDKINRIMINVGVAYGSDPQQARELLLKIAKAHPLLLETPEPIATFEGYGNGMLQFTLRVYLPTLDNRLTVTHDLYTAIHKQFAEAGLKIPYPQQELHIHQPHPAQPPAPATPGLISLEGIRRTPAADLAR